MSNEAAASPDDHRQIVAILAMLGDSVVKRNGQTFRLTESAIEFGEYSEAVALRIYVILEEHRSYITIAPINESGVDLRRSLTVFPGDIVPFG